MRRLAWCCPSSPAASKKLSLSFWFRFRKGRRPKAGGSAVNRVGRRASLHLEWMIRGGPRRCGEPPPGRSRSRVRACGSPQRRHDSQPRALVHARRGVVGREPAGRTGKHHSAPPPGTSYVPLGPHRSSPHASQTALPAPEPRRSTSREQARVAVNRAVAVENRATAALDCDRSGGGSPQRLGRPRDIHSNFWLARPPTRFTALPPAFGLRPLFGSGNAFVRDANVGAVTDLSARDSRMRFRRQPWRKIFRCAKRS